VIELDFVADDAPEYWNLTGAGAREEQSLHDLYPGRLRFRVNGTDLSPIRLVSWSDVAFCHKEGDRRQRSCGCRFATTRPAAGDALTATKPSASGQTGTDMANNGSPDRAAWRSRRRRIVLIR
jgi:hypothetical protein